MINKLFGHPKDPSDWDGENTKCKLCDKAVEMNDEYCEDHQRCCDCGDNDYCECKETLYCKCGRYKEDGYELCIICIND